MRNQREWLDQCIIIILESGNRDKAYGAVLFAYCLKIISGSEYDYLTRAIWYMFD